MHIHIRKPWNRDSKVSEMTESRLNLGCSNQILDGWVNVDCRQLTGVDKIQDLDNKHWDWPDGSVDEILMSHCLEHVKDPLAALRECRRVLKVDGKITIRVPHANGSLAYSPNHYSRFSVQWFLAFACSANDQIKLDDVWIEQKLKLHLFLLYRVANSAVETWMAGKWG